MVITMQFPFTTAAGVKVESVTTRRLKVKDLKSIGERSGGSETQLELNGVALMCNLVPEDLEEMDAADYQAVKGRFLEVVGITGSDLAGTKPAGKMVPLPA
ncbi:phage tail assembly protein [Iodobacter fluviatilis]|uniref:Tail assembly chaperone E/41/14-like protein n=1 Tax=Iodobacter fluviatilis TaxID=537 RepID=A0A377QA02_9NEIS|nr:phage tail assembly protein [Iodobacter fluviatilis]TCU88520.1 tail assembly chaperone E/41/14-like protein [Iodobacter fluviatilis]STQ91409.1 Uncharacterised protein [Iodobacter fluviatilis]